MKAVVALAIAALALSASAVRPAPAAAATPCWKLLLNDWYDGRIDNTYPLHCYDDALKHLPADVQTYSSAHDDIQRALLAAKAQLRRAGKTVTPNTPVPPADGGTSGSGDSGKSGGSSTTTTTGTTPTTSEPGREPTPGIGQVADKVNNSGPSSIPLPLIVLGALALLLVAAGSVGLIAKRRQGR